MNSPSPSIPPVTISRMYTQADVAMRFLSLLPDLGVIGVVAILAHSGKIDATPTLLCLLAVLAGRLNPAALKPGAMHGATIVPLVLSFGGILRRLFAGTLGAFLLLSGLFALPLLGIGCGAQRPSAADETRIGLEAAELAACIAKAKIADAGIVSSCHCRERVQASYGRLPEAGLHCEALAPSSSSSSSSSSSFSSSSSDAGKDGAL